eukprot:SAG22_NODE_398_length_11106_cov_67.829836_3_plen_124_part_00
MPAGYSAEMLEQVSGLNRAFRAVVGAVEAETAGDGVLVEFGMSPPPVVHYEAGVPVAGASPPHTDCSGLAVFGLGEATVILFHCLSLCFSAFPCGSAALTEDRCNQGLTPRWPRRPGCTRSGR